MKMSPEKVIDHLVDALNLQIVILLECHSLAYQLPRRGTKKSSSCIRQTAEKLVRSTKREDRQC